MANIKGKTKEGFTFSVNENIGKDFRIVTAMRKLNSGETMMRVEGMSDYAEAILGKDGIDEIIQFAINKMGYADTEFIVDQLHEIVGIVNEKSAKVKK